MCLYRHLPNQLTMLRLVLAAVFFVVLNQYRYGTAGVSGGWLVAALALFVLATITDALDGYLARRWSAESAFGRIMDPFCDKVLVLGAFIYLAGPRFGMQIAGPQGPIHVTVSGVHPWMVAVMLARELLVTGVRGELEGAGVSFGSNIFGKAKMILQSAGIPLILAAVWFDPRRYGGEGLSIALTVLMGIIVAVTVLSGVPYVVQGWAVFRGPKGDGRRDPDGIGAGSGTPMESGQAPARRDEGFRSVES
jgi:CDP-diacylglycerol--glycerol-3-phosphate 3-phosphatidyltransferase